MSPDPKSGSYTIWLSGRKASVHIWNEMTSNSSYPMDLLGRLIDQISAALEIDVIVLDGHGGLDELTLAAAGHSDRPARSAVSVS